MASIIFIISMFHLLWVPNFMKIAANFSAGTKFARIYNFGSRSSVPSTILIFDLHLVPNFIKVGTHCNFETKSAQFPVKIRNFQIYYDWQTWPALSAKLHSFLVETWIWLWPLTNIFRKGLLSDGNPRMLFLFIFSVDYWFLLFTVDFFVYILFKKYAKIDN